jgi:hypothetical protein
MATDTVKISVRGKAIEVPAVEIDGQTIIVKGRWIKIATVQHEEWLETELKNPVACISGIKARMSGRLRPDIFTFTQKLPATEPKYGYACEFDSVAVARTSDFKEWWQGLPQETRKNVRRSQKRGVTVSIRPLDDALIRDLVRLNNESPVVQGRPNVHFGKSADEVSEDQSSFLDRSAFICAFCGDELVGYMKLVFRGNVGSILHILSKPSHQDKRPANAMIAKAVELCENKGVPFLVYGRFNYGKKRDNPLREFKVRNGFHEILIPRFFVPLTMWGEFCMKAKLHRGIIGILPHRIITFGIGMRSRWYEFVHSAKPV